MKGEKESNDSVGPPNVLICLGRVPLCVRNITAIRENTWRSNEVFLRLLERSYEQNSLLLNPCCVIIISKTTKRIDSENLGTRKPLSTSLSSLKEESVT